jgi:hypothetical protein
MILPLHSFYLIFLSQAALKRIYLKRGRRGTLEETFLPEKKHTKSSMTGLTAKHFFSI